MRVGFIGLGNIGEPLATNVHRRGFDLVVHDLRPEAATRLIAAGAAWADSPAEVAAAADVVLTSLPGPREVSAVLDGPRGVIAGIRAGCGWIDTSTTDRHQMQRLAALLRAKQVTVLEATITGGVQNAWKGRATVFVGGDDADVRAYQPVLDALGERVIYLGPLGAATVAKLISNMLSFVHAVALAEGLTLGARAGLDPALLLEAIQASYGGSFVANVDGPQILDGSDDPSFTIALACKDAALALDLGREVEAPLQLFPLVNDVLRRAHDVYGPSGGHLSTARVYEASAGLLLRPKRAKTTGG